MPKKRYNAEEIVHKLRDALLIGEMFYTPGEAQTLAEHGQVC